LYLDRHLLDYRRAWELQRELVDAKRSQLLKQDIALMLEHPPVFTVGRRGGLNNLKVPEGLIKSRGIEIIHVERGGDITYHGPGQIVVYPIVDLQRGRYPIIGLVESLEEIMIRTLADWGISGVRNPANRGVWVGGSKIGSVGIAVRRSISYHGLALNVNTALEPFAWVNPCGLEGVAMTAMKEVLGRTIAMEEARRSVAAHLESVFGARLEPVSLRRLERMAGLREKDAPRKRHETRT
jgi:lipoate-protein ligase B